MSRNLIRTFDSGRVVVVMEICKQKILLGLNALHQEISKELDAYSKHPGVFGNDDYVHRENLTCYKATLEAVQDIIDYVENLAQPDGMPYEQFQSTVLGRLQELYEGQVRLRAGIGMAIRCIESCKPS